MRQQIAGCCQIAGGDRVREDVTQLSRRPEAYVVMLG
jgi:hypothetical protein